MPEPDPGTAVAAQAGRALLAGAARRGLLIAIGSAQARDECARVEAREQHRCAGVERGGAGIDRVGLEDAPGIVEMRIEIDVARARAVARVGVDLDQLAAHETRAVLLGRLRPARLPIGA